MELVTEITAELHTVFIVTRLLTWVTPAECVSMLKVRVYIVEVDTKLRLVQGWVLQEKIMSPELETPSFIILEIE